MKVAINMKGVHSFIDKQVQLLLVSRWHALGYVLISSLLPYTTWLSMTLIALMTLRKGWKAGGWLLIPAMIANASMLMMSSSLVIALCNTLLTYVPCYLAAYILRITISWRMVGAFFFLLMFVAVFLLHTFMPDFILAQYMYVQAVLQNAQPNSALFEFLNERSGLNPMILASYFLGLQSIGVICTALCALVSARMIQSRLFYPGACKRELLGFRADKIGLILFLIMWIAVFQQNELAISVFPMLIFYFFLAGLSLSFKITSKRRPWSLLLFMLGSLFILPFLMLPLYVVIGSLDVLFNFRTYLHSDAGNPV